jgi:hypothetical protein
VWPARSATSVAGTPALIHKETPQLVQAQQVAQESVDALRPLVDEAGASPDVLSLYGAFHLVLAVVAARENERADAQELLRTARAVAERIGEDRNDFGTEFGPTNVGLHAVAISVDLGDAGAALDLAGDIDPSALSPERQGRFLVDVSADDAKADRGGATFARTGRRDRPGADPQPQDREQDRTRFEHDLERVFGKGWMK